MTFPRKLFHGIRSLSKCFLFKRFARAICSLKYIQTLQLSREKRNSPRRRLPPVYFRSKSATRSRELCNQNSIDCLVGPRAPPSPSLSVSLFFFGRSEIYSSRIIICSDYFESSKTFRDIVRLFPLCDTKNNAVCLRELNNKNSSSRSMNGECASFEANRLRAISTISAQE